LQEEFILLITNKQEAHKCWRILCSDPLY